MLTRNQIEDFRADIGDSKCVFTDIEIQRLYERAGTYAGAVLLALDQLLANASKFSDYTANESSEKKSQVFDQLMKLRGVWQMRVSADEIDTKTQQNLVIGRVVPIRKRKDTPYA